MCFHNSGLSVLQKNRVCSFDIDIFSDLLILTGNRYLHVGASVQGIAEYQLRVI